MARIIKSLSSKVDKATGKVEIRFRFIGGFRCECRAGSGIFIDPKQWNKAKGELKSATFVREQVDLKRKIDELTITIIDTFSNSTREEVDGSWLKTIIDKFHHPEKYIIVEEEAPKQSFFEVFDEFLMLYKIQDISKRNYMVIYRALKRYERYKSITLDLDEFNSHLIADFEQFLRIEHSLMDYPRYKKILKEIPENRTPKPRGNNAISALFSKLRTFWNWCVKKGKTTNPLKIEVKDEVYGTPYYITTDERKQIERTNLSRHPSLAIQRDIFVFHCCIGCRVSDLYKMTMLNVVSGAIEYVPRKTKDGNPVTVRVTLNDTAMTILQKYAYHNKGKGILPFIASQQYNYAIKIIFQAARINRIVQVRNSLTGESEPRPLYEVASSHIARRTFVGNIYKQVRDPNLVGALSGHKDGSKAFARYRNIDDEIKRELTSLLD